MTRQVPLSRGLFATVDDEDFALVSKWSWWPLRCSSNLIYAVTSISRAGMSKNIRLHRLILGLIDAPKTIVVDHIDGNPLNNTRANLRTGTQQQNSFNKRARQSRSGFKGVKLYGPSWRAQIKVAGKVTLLGTFKMPEDAARAYDDAARKLYGAFARVNFPQEGEQGCLVHEPLPFDREAYLIAHRARFRRAKQRSRAKSSPTPHPRSAEV